MATETNELAAGLAKINEGLRISYVPTSTPASCSTSGPHSSPLRLAELTGATVTVNEDTTVDVRVEGRARRRQRRHLRDGLLGLADLAGAGTDPVRVSIGGTAVTLRGGALGAAQDLLTGALPRLPHPARRGGRRPRRRGQREHAQGADLDGAAGTAFFTGTAATLQADPARSRRPTPRRARSTARTPTCSAPSTRPRAPTAAWSPTSRRSSSARRVMENQTILTAQVDASREALSGINVDEEMVNLLAAQRGYEEPRGC